MIALSKKEIAESLAKFIWSFKVGDNIVYNFNIVFLLYRSKEESKSEQKVFFNKPISIAIVSIIEAVFYDFICRLDTAKTHFPESISVEKKNRIKDRLEKEKSWFTKRDSFLGKDRRYKRTKNYQMKEIIEFLEEYELFGERDSFIYTYFKNASFLRNIIHIFNWRENFEIDEIDAFSESRLLKIEGLLVYVLDTMVLEYSRPFDSKQAEVWLSQMSI